MRPTLPPRSPRSGPPLQPCSAGCPGPRTEQQVRTSSRCELEKKREKKKREKEDDEVGDTTRARHDERRLIKAVVTNGKVMEVRWDRDDRWMGRMVMFRGLVIGVIIEGHDGGWCAFPRFLQRVMLLGVIVFHRVIVYTIIHVSFLRW